jgi:hypothetical protein
MLIAYATAEGALASDVGTGAGPYTTVLANEVMKPGVEAVAMFRNVQRRVDCEFRIGVMQQPPVRNWLCWLSLSAKSCPPLAFCRLRLISAPRSLPRTGDPLALARCALCEIL